DVSRAGGGRENCGHATVSAAGYNVLLNRWQTALGKKAFKDIVSCAVYQNQNNRTNIFDLL
ncbi:MAG TPA: hypothetical protein PLL93_14220, partial [bacterium]|nr:hypothetical protein [bacterium]